MRFLLKPLLLGYMLFFAILLWWRPAPVLLQVEAVDWARLYEQQHTPVEHLWGAMEMGRELIRGITPHAPLTEFIAEKMADRVVRVTGSQWCDWYARNFAAVTSSQAGSTFFRPDDSPVAAISREQGYLELRCDSNIEHLHFMRLPAGDFGYHEIPDNLHYPSREPAVAVFVGCLALGLLFRLRREEPGLVEASSVGRGCKITSVTLAGGSVLVALPFFYRIHHSMSAPPIILVGGFVMLAGLVGFVIFAKLLSMLRGMIAGVGLIAHWTYDPEEWKRFAEWEFRQEKSEKTNLLILISVIALVIGLGFWLIVRDKASGWVFLFLTGVVVLLWGVGWLVPRLNYRRNLNRLGQVYIGEAGVYINGAVHSWKLWGGRFESAEYRTEPFPLLLLSYSTLQAAGRSLFLYRQSVTVRIPVPRGKEAEGQRVVEHFAANRLRNS
jgi:hypothetical protein